MKLAADIHLLIQRLNSAERDRLVAGFASSFASHILLFHFLDEEMPVFKQEELDRFFKEKAIKHSRHVLTRLYRELLNVLHQQAGEAFLPGTKFEAPHDPVLVTQSYLALSRALRDKNCWEAAEHEVGNAIKLARKYELVEHLYEGLQMKLWLFLFTAHGRVSQTAQKLNEEIQKVQEQIRLRQQIQTDYFSIIDPSLFRTEHAERAQSLAREFLSRPYHQATKQLDFESLIRLCFLRTMSKVFLRDIAGAFEESKDGLQLFQQRPDMQAYDLSGYVRLLDLHLFTATYNERWAVFPPILAQAKQMLTEQKHTFQVRILLEQLYIVNQLLYWMNNGSLDTLPIEELEAIRDRFTQVADDMRPQRRYIIWTNLASAYFVRGDYRDSLAYWEMIPEHKGEDLVEPVIHKALVMRLICSLELYWENPNSHYKEADSLENQIDMVRKRLDYWNGLEQLEKHGINHLRRLVQTPLHDRRQRLTILQELEDSLQKVTTSSSPVDIPGRDEILIWLKKRTQSGD